MHFVTDVSTFRMKVLPLSSTRNMGTTSSSEYLVPLYDTTRLHIPAADNTYCVQSNKFIESYTFEIILLLKEC